MDRWLAGVAAPLTCHSRIRPACATSAPPWRGAAGCRGQTSTANPLRARVEPALSFRTVAAHPAFFPEKLTRTAPIRKSGRDSPGDSRADALHSARADAGQRPTHGKTDGVVWTRRPSISDVRRVMPQVPADSASQSSGTAQEATRRSRGRLRVQNQVGPVVLGVLSVVFGGYGLGELVLAYRATALKDWGEKAGSGAGGILLGALFADLAVQTLV
jgi:hypothetical protein